MPEIAIIFMGVIFLAIIVFGTISGVHKRTLAYREREKALDREASGARSGGASEKVEQLEQRVRVLERLATDRGQDLALQIENLREPATNNFSPTLEESQA